MPHGGFRLGPGSFCHDRLGGRLAPPTARQISTSGLQRGILPLRSQEPAGAPGAGGRSEPRPD